jgi:acetyl esterase/lipase
MTTIGGASSQAEKIVWRGMTRAQLDAAYNNSAAVKNSAEKLSDWMRRSAVLRAKLGELLDLPYGPRERNRIDIFCSGRSNAPLLVFIHGGYWQRNSKEIFSCMAEGPLAHGLDVALIGYTLAPEASLTEIVGELRTAIRWLRLEGPRLGIGLQRLIVSGWSAGGHLTAMLLSEADAGLAISGIFDIEPCRLNYLNATLKLTLAEQLALSPIRRQDACSSPLVITFGTAELPELQRQSRDYWSARETANLPSQLLPMPGHDHFSILEELAQPTGKLAARVARLAHS